MKDEKSRAFFILHPSSLPRSPGLMSYALATLWHERNRFLPGVLAVAFSALLIALQCGLLLGLFSITSLPIDTTRADIWVGYPDVLSVDLGKPIPTSWKGYLALPEIRSEDIEVYMLGFAYWAKPEGGSELCIIIGSRLEGEPLGAADRLTPDLRARLTYPFNIVVDRTEFNRLGIKRVGDTAEVSRQRVRVVGTVEGFKSLAGPYVFCSVRTARSLLNVPQDQTTYLLARCKRKEDAPKVVAQLRRHPDKLSAFTSEEFSLRSRMHWLTKTKAGIALGCAAALGLLVGAVVTSQTLYAAVIASLKEYAVLRALGIPRWRMAGTVLAQSFWVGVAGIGLALPAVFLLAQLGDELGARVMLPPWLLLAAGVVTMVMALLSGLFALRSLRQIEPVTLLR
jgi:putative ABC transport system permease protein